MRYLSIFFLLIIISCKLKETPLTAQQIINETITNSGADKVTNSQIEFKFRNKEYLALRKLNGTFKLFRKYKKEGIGTIEDIVSNNGHRRLVNAHEFKVEDSMSTKYANSVNSVHYFSVLPFGLNDKAVNKKLLPSVKIKDQEYYKIEITFNKEGGGEDFDDVFIYWIDKDSFLIDYLAYSFHVNGGGIRFRELKEQCVKEGIRFVDYNNYKALDDKIKLNDLDEAYENNQLKKVSEIVLENITVVTF